MLNESFTTGPYTSLGVVKVLCEKIQNPMNEFTSKKDVLKITKSFPS